MASVSEVSSINSRAESTHSMRDVGAQRADKFDEMSTARVAVILFRCVVSAEVYLSLTQQ